MRATAGGSREFVVPNVDFAAAVEPPAIAAAPLGGEIRLVYSSQLGVQVFAGRPDWCRQTVDLRVVAADASVVGVPSLAALLQRLGSAVIASGCPVAKSVRYTGSAGNGPPVWQQTATALDSWALHHEAPPPAAGLDLDRAGPAALAPPAAARPPPPLATSPTPAEQSPELSSPAASPHRRSPRQQLRRTWAARPGRWMPRRSRSPNVPRTTRGRISRAH